MNSSFHRPELRVPTSALVRDKSPYDASLHAQSAPDSPVSSKSSSTSTLVEDVTGPKAHQLSTLRLLLAHIGAAMTLFLATTDATIVSTILPTIASEFNATQIEYTWVGVAYMLTQTALQPLYGKLSNLVGRKTILYASMLIFVTGSMLCGAAKSMMFLIVSRALAGIGGGGIVSLVWTITSEIVEIESRAKWSQALSITWSCSAIAGPLLGGLFSGQSGLLSWRWAFYLNLPVCLLALGVIYVSLRGVEVGRSHDVSWRIFGKSFDFLGLLLFLVGSSCVVVGFSFASDLGWSNPITLVLIIGGPIVLIGGGFYEVRTKRDALFPHTAFTDPTTIIILVVNFLHNFAFNSGTYYLALYFQSVKGSTPLQSGMYMLPYSLGSSIASMPAAWFISYRQRRKSDLSGQRLMICAGLAISALGFGLMYTLNGYTTRVLQNVYPLCAGIGLGMLFHAPYQVFLRSLKESELASGTSAFFLVRFTGATIGLSVAGAAFNGQLARSLPLGVGPASLDLEHLALIQPFELRTQVLHAVSASIRTIWAICCPCLSLAFLISLFVRTTACVVERPTKQPLQEKPASLSTPEKLTSVMGDTMA